MRAGLGFRIGDNLTYRFSQKRIIAPQANTASGVTPAIGAFSVTSQFQVEQSGELLLRVYDETATGWVIGFEFMRPSVKMILGSTFHDLSNQMTGEALASVSKLGRIEELVLPSVTGAEAAEQWKDILTRWQVVLPKDPSTNHWTTVEQDTTGVFVALYSRAAAPPSGVIKKSKQKYLKVLTTSQTVFGGNSTVSGETTITLAPYQTHIVGHEQFKLSVLGIGARLDTGTEFEFRLQKCESSDATRRNGAAKVAEFKQSHEPSLLTAQMTAAVTASASPVSKPPDIRDAIAQLESVLANGRGGSSDEQKALEQLCAAIQGDAHAADVVIDRLMQESGRSDLASALIGMLGAAGTPQAQQGLLAVATSKDRPMEHREMALFSFAQVQQPVPKVDVILQGLHQGNESIGNNALLILAAMGDRVRESDPQRFEAISRYVLDTAGATDLGLNERVVGLGAIRNLGPKEVPDFVLDWLKTGDELIRRSSIESLQRVHTATADSLLIGALQADPSDSVRSAAAKLLSDTSRAAGLEALIHAAATDASEQVRKDSVIGLSQWVSVDQLAQDTLTRIAQNDSSMDVRQLASQLLTQHAQLNSP
jgi:HEAT repeat protein